MNHVVAMMTVVHDVVMVHIGHRVHGLARHDDGRRGGEAAGGSTEEGDEGDQFLHEDVDSKKRVLKGSTRRAAQWCPGMNEKRLRIIGGLREAK
jgi:hypothetical protein